MIQRYLDVGCGYGDFLNKIREFIPYAIGIEKNARIFYIFDISKPDHIKIVDAHWGIDKKYDPHFRRLDGAWSGFSRCSCCQN